MQTNDQFLTLSDRSAYLVAAQELVALNPIPNDFLGLIGTAADGSIIPFPDSFRQGYRDAFTPTNQGRSMAMNFLIVGRITDGSVVFSPSYKAGLDYGNQQKNNAILSILAGSGRRLWIQLNEASQRIEQLESEVSRRNKED